MPGLGLVGGGKCGDKRFKKKVDGYKPSDLSDLLGCPFCGSQPGPLASEIDGSLVCDTCGARGPTHKFEWMKGQDGIHGRWNLRAT